MADLNNGVFEAAPEKNMREDILKATAQLFKKKGFNGTSMQDIASAVGILKGSIYYYFNSKNEIFREVLNNGINPPLKNAELIMGEKISAREKLRKLVRSHLEFIMDHNFSLVIYFQEREKLPPAQMEIYLEKRSRYEKIFRDVLREGIAEGGFPKVDVALTVLAILGMCNWIIQWYNPKGKRSGEEIRDYMDHLIFEMMLRID